MLPSLTFRHFNDTTMEAYLNEIYPESTPMGKLLQSIPKQVLKADIFRYTLLLHKGGIYTDTDTAGVRKFEDWGKDPIDLVSPNTFPESSLTDIRNAFVQTHEDRPNSEPLPSFP